MPEWNELFRFAEHRWNNIHERIPEFAGLMHEKIAHRILDLGCGAGRHTLFFAGQGFETYGMDISDTGLEYTRQRLDQAGLKADLKTADMALLPYPDEFFDGVISIHVIFHNTHAGMLGTISEIWRVLRPGGLILVTFLSRRGYRYGRGTMLEEDTYITNLGADAGIPHHFSSLGEVEQDLSKFILLNAHLDESFSNNSDQLSSHWDVLAQKPETKAGDK